MDPKTLETIWPILLCFTEIPQGWSANIDTPIQLCLRDSGNTNSSRAVSDWDKSNVELTVEVTHSNLGTQMLTSQFDRQILVFVAQGEETTPI